MKKENKLPEEEAADALEIWLKKSTEQYRVMAEKAAKKPTIIVHNKVGWVGWVLTLVIGIILGAGIVLYSLRTDEVRAVFHTEPTTQSAADSSLSDSTLTLEADKEDALTRLRIKYGK